MHGASRVWGGAVLFWARSAARSSRAAAWRAGWLVCPGGRWAASGCRPSRMVVRHVDYAELLQQVQAAAALDRATAERVLLATMVTLAERLSHQELERLSAWLPDQLQAALHAGAPACQPFDADEFVGRVAERVAAQPQVAWTQVRAVLGTLDREVVELQALRQRLPRDVDALMA